MDSAVFETETAVASAFALSTTETITLTVGNFSVDFAPAGTESGGEDAYADAARLAAGLRAAANTEATGASQTTMKYLSELLHLQLYWF